MLKALRTTTCLRSHTSFFPRIHKVHLKITITANTICPLSMCEQVMGRLSIAFQSTLWLIVILQHVVLYKSSRHVIMNWEKSSMYHHTLKAAIAKEWYVLTSAKALVLSYNGKCVVLVKVLFILEQACKLVLHWYLGNK